MASLALTSSRGGWLRPTLPLLVAALLILPAPALSHHGPTTCLNQDAPFKKRSVPAAERTSLCLVNVYRQANGLPPLALNSSLAIAARWHSRDMVERDYFNHDAPAPAPHGTNPGERATNAGYTAAAGIGENIGADGDPFATPHHLFNAWKTSPGHNRNMLGRDPGTGEPLAEPYEAVGIGLAIGAPKIFVNGYRLGPAGRTGTQLFGTKADGGTDTALELVGGDPGRGRACKAAKRWRKQVKQQWARARAAKRRIATRKREATGTREERRLAKKLKRKRKLLAKRRQALRRATAKRQEVCRGEPRGR